MPGRECRDCGELIIFLKAGPDRYLPVDAESVDDPETTEYEPRSGHVSHWDTCQAGTNVRREARGG